MMVCHLTGYINNSQFTNDNFAIVIRVESGTRLKFFGRHNYSNCQNNGTANNWRAGKDHIRMGFGHLYNVANTILLLPTNQKFVSVDDLNSHKHLIESTNI